MNRPTVKLEPRADDDEINQLAARMMEQHRQKAAQQLAQRPLLQQQQLLLQQRQRTAGQANITSYFGSGSASTADSSQRAKTPDVNPDVLDSDSARMRFGWQVVGTVPLPCLFRKGECYCPVRAVEKMILNPYLQKLPMDVCNCTSIKSYFITEIEAKLLNEINYRHCDYYYGREAFTIKDCIVRVDDARQFAEFLSLCERKMVNMQSKPDDRCGFLRINGESVVPFTIKRVKVGKEMRDTRFVPLFYFEGETEHLKHKSEQLTGWDLAYLKLCCKVQGIRSELFQSDTCDVVSLEDVKRHFPSGTQFQPWWPVKRFEFKLTNQPKPSFWECQPPPSSSQVTPVSQTAAARTSAAGASVRQQPTSAAAFSNAAQLARSQQQATWAASRMSATMLSAQQQQQQQRNSAAAAAVPASPVSTTYAQLFLTNGVPITSVLTAVNGHIRQTPQHGQRLATSTGLVASGYQALLTQQQVFAQMQMNQPVAGYSAPAVVSRQESTIPSARPQTNGVSNGRQAPPLLPMSSGAAKRPAPEAVDLSRSSLDPSRLMMLPPRSQYPRQHTTEPFVVQKTKIDSRTVPCINGAAYDFSTLYVSIHDLVKAVFPNVQVRAFQEILGVLGICLFKATQEHSVVMALSGCVIPPDRTIGLVRLTDLLNFMPQIVYMCQSSQAGNPNAKRIRS